MFNLSPLSSDWYLHIAPVLGKEKMQSLQSFLLKEELFYPPQDLIFNALNTTPLNQTKVVILGQDPYHNIGQAMGLSFSVPQGFKIPPSLKNIYREAEEDLGLLMPNHGDLTNWATQGVLLLNTVLTVRPHTPNSHKGKGWEFFTDAVINCVSNNMENVVFILWGGKAKAKSNLIDPNKHLILNATHPSPLGANKGGFFGCKHFSITNEYLKSVGKTPIEWDKL